jgi:hypothetical protein
MQTMQHIVKSCPLAKLSDGLMALNNADDIAVDWLGALLISSINNDADVKQLVGQGQLPRCIV